MLFHWLWFILLSLNLSGLNSKKIHNCIHNKIKPQKLRKTHVEYRYKINLIKNKSNRRRLTIPIEEYENIRIKPYWGAIDASTLSTTKKNTIKATVSAAINYFESVLSVIPVEGPLYISRSCPYGYDTDGPLHTYWNCNADGVSQECGLVTIPSSHLRNDWMYDGFRDIDLNSYPKGNGLKDTDLIIYVSAETTDCGSNTLAWALSCQLDQYGRPIAGNINFCPSKLDEIDWKFDVITTLHELTHVLVFSDGLFSGFIDQFGNPLNIDEIVEKIDKTDLGLSNNYIITPNVKSFVRKHYNCSNLPGAPIEDDGGDGTVGSHWEEHHVNGEYMIGVTYSKLNSVSGLTLSLFEDSGWYKVNYDYSEPFLFGKNEGCSFFDLPCFNSNGISNFPQYYCGQEYQSKPLCPYDYSARSYCVHYYNSSTIPDEFKYFTDIKNALYGSEHSEFCSFADAYTDFTVTDFQHICWDERGNTVDGTDWGQQYGINSRCIETVVTNVDFDSAFCYPIQCNQNEQSLTVNIRSGSIVCNKQDKFMHKMLLNDGIGNSYNISCPNYDSICGINSKPFECVWGFWNDNLNTCICAVGYDGNICTNSLDNITNNEVELGPIGYNVEQPINMCLKLSNDYTELNGNWEYDGIHNNLYSYYKKDNYYLYFDSWYHLWTIGSNLDDDYSESTVIGICSVGERPFYISDCSHMFYFVDNKHEIWTQDINLVIENNECSISPTPSPTLCPTCNNFNQSRPVNTFYTDGIGTKTPTTSQGEGDHAITVKQCFMLSFFVSVFFVFLVD